MSRNAATITAEELYAQITGDLSEKPDLLSQRNPREISAAEPEEEEDQNHTAESGLQTNSLDCIQLDAQDSGLNPPSPHGPRRAHRSSYSSEHSLADEWGSQPPRGGSPTHSRSRTHHHHHRSPRCSRSRSPPRRANDGLCASSPSHSRSHSPSSNSNSSNSHSSRHGSPSRSHEHGGRRSRSGSSSPSRSMSRDSSCEGKQLYGTPSAGSGTEGKAALAQEIVFSTTPLTLGVIGGADGDYEVDDPDDPTLPPGGGLVEGLTGRGRAAATVVDEIVGSQPPPPLTAVPIYWRGPATSVFLIRAGDDDWMGRQEMVREGVQEGNEPSTEPFTTMIYLPPGTHHFRFIVDGQTVVAPAHEIPNTVDDQGFIANYVAVPRPVVFPLTAARPASASTGTSANATVSSSASSGGRAKRYMPSLPDHPDESFWAHSSVDGSAEDVPRLVERVLASPGSGEHGHEGGGRGKGWSGGWTSEIPEALGMAAAQEEAYLEAQLQQQDRHASGRDIVLDWFGPEPSIPPVPRLPRHLERQILNRPSPGVVIPRGATGAVGSGSSMNAVGVEATPAVNPALRVTKASGTDVSTPMIVGRAPKLREKKAMYSNTSGSGSNLKAKSDSGNDGTTTPSPRTHPQFGAVSAVGTLLIADDPNVLQTPSHGVLYHLCTSPIRDKVIAIGTTTRYRQKYLTTVYYKPAELTTREK